MQTLRALIVDDSTVYRRIMEGIVSSIAGVEVAASAKDGQEACMLVRRRHFDVVFLDVEMPVRSGLETLKDIRRTHPNLPIIMVSGSNRETTDITIRALEAGAYDFIPKPSSSGSDASRQALIQQITPIIRSLHWQKAQTMAGPNRMNGAAIPPAMPVATAVTESLFKSFAPALAVEEPSPAEQAPTPPVAPPPTAISPPPPLKTERTQAKATPRPTAKAPAGNKVPALKTSAARAKANRQKNSAPTIKPEPTKAATTGAATKQPAASSDSGFVPVEPSFIKRAQLVAANLKPPSLKKFKPSLLLIGVSTGGPAALMEVIPKLKPSLGIPILIVQHMPPHFTASLANNLDARSTLTVKEAVAGEELLPNTVYLAPGGQHMVLEEKTKRQYVIGLNEDPPVHSCRPSVDVLFRSVANLTARQQILSVIMTGMGRDGAQGVLDLKQKGLAYSLTQSAETCVVYGMPRAVDEAGLSDEQVPLAELANRIHQLVAARAAKGATS